MDEKRSWLQKVESWMFENMPVVFADNVSSVLHAVLVFVPGFVLASIPAVGPALGVGWSDFMGGWYWHREDMDEIKALKETDAVKRGKKLADSKKDRWFAFGAAVLNNIVVLAFGAAAF